MRPIRRENPSPCRLYQSCSARHTGTTVIWRRGEKQSVAVAKKASETVPAELGRVGVSRRVTDDTFSPTSAPWLWVARCRARCDERLCSPGLAQLEPHHPCSSSTWVQAGLDGRETSKHHVCWPATNPRSVGAVAGAEHSGGRGPLVPVPGSCSQAAASEPLAKRDGNQVSTVRLHQTRAASQKRPVPTPVRRNTPTANHLWPFRVSS